MPLEFNGKPPVIPPGSTVLVTGANGYIGSHIADQLIQAGYLVRGTSRDTAKTVWMTELFDKKYGKGKFEAIVVEDMAVNGAFDEACKGMIRARKAIVQNSSDSSFLGVSGVIHVATIVTFDHDPNKVIPGVVKGAVNAAGSAAKQASVKRFVFTSSSTAITAPKPNVEFTISTDDWNDEEVEAAWKPPPYEKERAWAVYGASKTQAEQEMWKFAKEQKPGFVLNTVLPNTNFGEILSDKQPASTGGWPKKLYYGDIDAVKDIPPQWSKQLLNPWSVYRCSSGWGQLV